MCRAGVYGERHQQDDRQHKSLATNTVGQANRLSLGDCLAPAAAVQPKRLAVREDVTCGTICGQSWPRRVSGRICDAFDGSRSMPIYEYKCRGCGRCFETLVRAASTPACPGCGSPDLERLLSLFAVSSEQRTESSLQRARKDLTTSLRDERVAEREHVMEHINED
jgi:putative FmdB family regulatory protein